MILILGHGPDSPPVRLLGSSFSTSGYKDDKSSTLPIRGFQTFSWRFVFHFLLWALIWSVYVLVLSAIYLKEFGGLNEMFRK